MNVKANLDQANQAQRAAMDAAIKLHKELAAKIRGTISDFAAANPDDFKASFALSQIEEHYQPIEGFTIDFSVSWSHPKTVRLQDQ